MATCLIGCHAVMCEPYEVGISCCQIRHVCQLRHLHWQRLSDFGSWHQWLGAATDTRGFTRGAAELLAEPSSQLVDGAWRSAMGQAAE